MTIEQLRGMRRAKPFQPFELRLADGRALRVPHPEVLAELSTGRTVVVATPDGLFEVVDLLMVVGLKRIAANGKRARR